MKGTERTRATVAAVLVLATLAFAGSLVESHSHEPLASGLLELPAFSAGHSQPDHSSHVEAATRIESSSCIACLHRQRQDSLAALSPSFSGPSSSSPALLHGDDARHESGARPGPGSRAPPKT